MSSDRLTILAVDDEHTQLEDLARLLRSFPSVEDVECASDGHDALVKASAQQYDAIFLDVRMPDLDGLELGRVLRRFATPPQLVFVSAYDGAAVDAFELREISRVEPPRRFATAIVSASAWAGAWPPWRPSSPRGATESIAEATRSSASSIRRRLTGFRR